MVINEIKREKYNLLFLGLFGVLAVLVFQQTLISNQINRTQETGIDFIKHTFNQSQNNFDGIFMSVNLTKENHEDHVKELANQKIMMNQTTMENKLLDSINISLAKIANTDKAISTDDSNLVKEDNKTTTTTGTGIGTNTTLSRGLSH